MQLWDLAGQDVYMISHALHFSHRCIYTLLWKPGKPLDAIMRHLTPWLESLATHVPDARIVLVASHCKTNISDDDFLALSREVEAAVLAKVLELNDITRLEVDKLRTQLAEATKLEADLVGKYTLLTSTKELRQKDSAFLQQQGQGLAGSELFSARANAVEVLPRSLRTRASEVLHYIKRRQMLEKRLQLLLGIRNGASPDKRPACKMTLHCNSVDSAEGHGIVELRAWLYDFCRSLPFMGEMISSTWTAVAEVFKHFGDSVLTQAEAIALIRQHLPLLRDSDEKLWSVIEFWSCAGQIFEYESQIVRNPGTLMSLLKPLLHHEPLKMMTRNKDMLMPESLASAAARVELEKMLRNLQATDELTLDLLNHLHAWHSLCPGQRNSMMKFFECSRLLCSVNERHDVRLITSRLRAKPHLTEAVEKATESSYHALYLLPLNHIAIISHVLSTVFSLKHVHSDLQNVSGRDSLIVHRVKDPSCACVFIVENFASGLVQNHLFSSLSDQLGESFSCVLWVASSDFGMFKFAAECADVAMDSGSFGTRYQCWVTVTHAALSSPVKWVQFNDSSPLAPEDVRFGLHKMLCRRALSRALQCNHHKFVIKDQKIIDMFQPRSSIFVSHAWGDGTGEFAKRLKKHLEHQTLASVWLDKDGLNKKQELLIPKFREALCQARVVFVLLTPSYLTRPNCLRELRWALDFEEKGRMRVVLLSLHSAVTFGERQQLLKDGPLHGLVFSSKEEKVMRLCPEAIALVKRLNDWHQNLLPWHELQAWRSDSEKCDWEEHRRFVQGGVWCGADMTVRLTGGPEGLIEQTVTNVVKDWLTFAVPQDVNECAPMDDTDALSSTDVESADDVCAVLNLEIYPEAAAASLKSKMQAVMLQEQQAKNTFPSVAAFANAFRHRRMQVAAAAVVFMLYAVLHLDRYTWSLCDADDGSGDVTR